MKRKLFILSSSEKGPEVKDTLPMFGSRDPKN